MKDTRCRGGGGTRQFNLARSFTGAERGPAVPSEGRGPAPSRGNTLRPTPNSNSRTILSTSVCRSPQQRGAALHDGVPGEEEEERPMYPPACRRPGADGSATSTRRARPAPPPGVTGNEEPAGNDLSLSEMTRPTKSLPARTLIL